MEFKRREGNTEKVFTVIPYDPDNEYFSSSQITLTPYKQYYWYMLSDYTSKVVAVDDNGESDFFDVFSQVVNGFWSYPPLEVSGDALVGTIEYDVRIEFPDKDTMTVEKIFGEEWSDPHSEHFKLRRKK